MADPLSLSVIGATVLNQGVQFLYAQASELLKRWRERRDNKDAAVTAELQPPADILAGEVAAATPDDERLGQLHEELSELRKALVDIADGEAVDPSDEATVSEIEALRRAIEVIYGQRITFKGERREPSGPLVEADVDVERVRGDVAAVRAQSIRAGVVKARVKAKDVEGNVNGVNIEGDIG